MQSGLSLPPRRRYPWQPIEQPRFAVPRALLGFDSQDQRLLYLMAQVKTDQGKLQDAITFLEKAGATEEELARVHIDLGRLYYRFGLDDRAHKELTRVLLLLPPASPLQKPVTDLLARIKAKE